MRARRRAIRSSPSRRCSSTKRCRRISRPRASCVWPRVPDVREEPLRLRPASPARCRAASRSATRACGSRVPREDRERHQEDRPRRRARGAHDLAQELRARDAPRPARGGGDPPRRGCAGTAAPTRRTPRAGRIPRGRFPASAAPAPSAHCTDLAEAGATRPSTRRERSAPAAGPRAAAPRSPADSRRRSVSHHVDDGALRGELADPFDDLRSHPHGGERDADEKSHQRPNRSSMVERCDGNRGVSSAAAATVVRETLDTTVPSRNLRPVSGEKQPDARLDTQRRSAGSGQHAERGGESGRPSSWRNTLAVSMSSSRPRARRCRDVSYDA